MLLLMRPSLPLGVAAAASALLALGACSSNNEKSAVDIKKELSTTFQAGGQGLSKDRADCFADLVIEEVGVDKLQGVDLSAEAPPKEIEGGVAAASARAVTECEPSSG